MSNESTEQPDLSPMASPRNDFRKLKRSGKATASEITSFLAKMRGKSPREVLGAVANSNLMQSFIQATIGVAVFILIFTLIPWVSGMVKGEKTAETKPAAKEQVEPAAGTDTAPKETEESPSGEVDIDRTDKKSAADTIGVTEEKQAPANVNPLDGSNDDLLDGLE